jgi:CofD-related protein of GAK system
MALADLSEKGGREIFALFTYRLSKKDDHAVLLAEVQRMAQGKHILIDLVPETKRDTIRAYIAQFLDVMPDNFDLRGASVGNLILTAGYFEKDRQLAPVIDRFSQLALVRGTVRPVIDRDLHLAAELADGSVVVGQHLLTGKEVGPLASPIKRVWMTESLESAEPVKVSVSADVEQMIRTADLICYPIGSFYSSVVANLLPDGVAGAVAEASCPKVFVPNPGHDPELAGHTVVDQVDVLLRTLHVEGMNSLGLDAILVDRQGMYEGGLDIPALEGRGVRVVEMELLDEDGMLFSPALLSQALFAFSR